MNDPWNLRHADLMLIAAWSVGPLTILLCWFFRSGIDPNWLFVVAIGLIWVLERVGDSLKRKKRGEVHQDAC